MNILITDLPYYITKIRHSLVMLICFQTLTSLNVKCGNTVFKTKDKQDFGKKYDQNKENLQRGTNP